jgi:hypothetical protein
VQAFETVTPRAAVANLRRSVIMSAGLGVLGLIVLGLLGHLAMGAFLILGLVLGAGNTWLVQRSVVTYANSEAGNKKGRFTRSVLGRLGIVTLIALGCLLLVRPDGVGVLAGVAIFQMLMLGGASVTTFKQLKQQ